jgi:general secretion pathway protein M
MKITFWGQSISLRTPALLVFIALSALGFYQLRVKHQWTVERLQEINQRYARLAGLEASRVELYSAESAALSSLAAGIYPVGQDISQAGNDAQRRVRDVVTAAKLQVMSSQVLAPKNDPVFDRIPISVRLEGDLVALQGALLEIPKLSPHVLIDGLSVQTIGAVKGDVAQRLAIQLSLSVLRARS